MSNLQDNTKSKDGIETDHLPENDDKSSYDLQFKQPTDHNPKIVEK